MSRRTHEERLKRWKSKRFQGRQKPAQTKAEFDAFYQTKEWRRLRYQAILLYGRVCMCCGRPAMPVHVDHIKPRSRFPALQLDISNLQVLCEDCNIGKGGWDQTDWRHKSV